MEMYVMQCEGYYKIGVSSQTELRLNTIQTGNPFPVSIHSRYRLPKPDVAERKLHSKFKAKRVRGEWFKLEPSDIDHIATKYGRYQQHDKLCPVCGAKIWFSSKLCQMCYRKK